MRRIFALVALVAVSLLSAGCGKSEPVRPATDRLAAAAKALDDTSGVKVDLHTDAIPKGVNGLLSAIGVGTSAPAFKGNIKVLTNGLPAGVPVVAVDGVVYIDLGGWQPIKPAEFGAPDPAKLFGTSGGLSGLLNQATDVKAGEDTRRGDKVYSTITATIPGSAVQALVPVAADAPFKASFLLDEKDVASRVQITGSFYPKSGEQTTYTIDLSDYGTTATITKP